jgi:hypothetical protein
MPEVKRLSSEIASAGQFLRQSVPDLYLRVSPAERSRPPATSLGLFSLTAARRQLMAA